MSSEMREFIEQMDILVDDFYKYQEGDARVPFVVIRDAVMAAISAYQDCRALLARTEAGALCEDEGCPHHGTAHECRGDA